MFIRFLMFSMTRQLQRAFYVNPYFIVFCSQTLSSPVLQPYKCMQAEVLSLVQRLSLRAGEYMIQSSKTLIAKLYRNFLNLEFLPKFRYHVRKVFTLYSVGGLTKSGFRNYLKST